MGTNKITVPSGTYVVIRKAVNISGNGIICGKGYNAGQFISSVGSDSALYVSIEHYDTQSDIVIYYYLGKSDTAYLFIEAISLT